jgi:uncharacterized membrane protein YtjA (UPF0391 family)
MTEKQAAEVVFYLKLILCVLSALLGTTCGR